MTYRPSLLEIFLFQVIIWLGLWLLTDYVATLLTLAVGAIVLAVLVIAMLAELVERSKVPRRYFSIMALSLLAIIVAAGIYVSIFGGKLAFLEQ
ncbi:MAG: hypothetical protein LH618_20180 [Saprospiraceae bacterium]|nr:hypothetical protein [Saprospiraceae bacterium]